MAQSGFTEPLRVALEEVMLLAGKVVTIGKAGVPKIKSLPTLVPALLVATNWK